MAVSVMGDTKYISKISCQKMNELEGNWWWSFKFTVEKIIQLKWPKISVHDIFNVLAHVKLCPCHELK